MVFFIVQVMQDPFYTIHDWISLLPTREIGQPDRFPSAPIMFPLDLGLPGMGPSDTWFFLRCFPDHCIRFRALSRS